MYVCVYTKNRRGEKMSKSNAIAENYISIDEAAEYIGIKTVTLRNWIKKKPDIPAHRVGKLWKFKRSELDAWIASGKSAE
jgi:excisionase family DNA binding protein